ncbi:MAG: hypothetical protein ACXVAY_16985 [Mucilaginibacter sp.]
MNHIVKIVLFLMVFLVVRTNAQEKKQPPVSVGGDMGISYEGYGLDKTPEQSTPDFYHQGRPWNLLRYSFNPVFNFGGWSIPFNFNFSALQNNFGTPSLGGGHGLWGFLTNPTNNFGISPKIGNTEILLGTQTLKYSDLSTGDIGVFGYGVNLSPGKFRIRLFNGVSQNPVDYVAATLLPPSPGVVGAYQRNQWMGQLGLEEKGKYFVGFNFVHSADQVNSITSLPLPPVEPQQNMIVSFLANVTTGKGWNYHVELGQSFHTRNLTDPLSISPVEDLQPFITSHSSTDKDNAIMLGIAKKGTDWEIGGKVNYYGAGYYTAGYPFMTNDRIEYLGNTHFNAWEKKINVIASIGERFGNISHTSGPSTTNQLIANVNTMVQFSDKFNLNMSFNNFGFNSPGLSGYKSVNNDISINPTYTWGNSKMSNLLSGTYTLSKYDETTTSGTTHNNTQTALLLYVPTVFSSKFNPDFSIMWFKDVMTPLVDISILNATAGLTWKASKKFSLKGQLQYNISTTSPFTADKNMMATASFDWKLYNKLSWQLALSGNVYHYGSDLLGSSLVPFYGGNPAYFESTIRTGLQYRF